MRIIADENIPFVKEAFSAFGEVITVSGRSITNLILRDADILLVRSITRVDRELLAGTEVRFVGTATIGVDHINTSFLAEKNIGFASAPGSNADSVAEYVVASLFFLKKKYGFLLSDKKLGIIGAGNIGSRVNRHARALGMPTLLCDPPCKRLTGNREFVPFEQVVAESDIVTFHVPLNVGGQDNTVHLVNDQFFSMVKKGAILINTSRGAVIDEQSLCVHRHLLGGLVMDVWNNEPNIDTDVVSHTDIATPHIAGYSYDGKLRGTEMLYQAACTYFGRVAPWSPFSNCSEDGLPELISPDKRDPVADAVQKVYPIYDDDCRLRNLSGCDKREYGVMFDQLRKNYPKRREFLRYSIDAHTYPLDVCSSLKALGFNLIHRTNQS